MYEDNKFQKDLAVKILTSLNELANSVLTMTAGKETWNEVLKLSWKNLIHSIENMQISAYRGACEVYNLRQIKRRLINLEQIKKQTHQLLNFQSSRLCNC